MAIDVARTNTPETKKSLPEMRFASYQIFGSERVFRVRQPYREFGGTFPRIKGMLKQMKRSPTTAKRRENPVTSLMRCLFL
jgi:hypothetical protein